ncbi:2OG-Fe dioxygenase family protein [Nocardia asteroides]|uniref:2OG-Fe dioxygenase family protein n=1 Tax=Nocardia asteroides TaxID=1824 RepID=UPI001E433831|nr:2OG-Fe dioxygenase family protein [Nocardia asteroides]UGT61095.1 2OG-Fe dioxygenase family protein [Nocardia asteroides]
MSDLTDAGVHLLPAAETARRLGASPGTWDRFRKHWEELRVDRTRTGVHSRTLHRCGHFQVSLTGAFELLAHRQGGEPQADALTDSFATDPLLAGLLRLLLEFAAELDDATLWDVRAHPLRELAATETAAATPRRLDVTLAAQLLVSRDNAEGGAATLSTADGTPVRTVAPDEPGTLLLIDDRRIRHAQSAIRPVAASRPALRDLLEVTFTPA